VDLQVIEAHGATRSSALTHTVPVVNDADPRSCALDPGDMQWTVGAQVGQDRDPVGKERARAVALLPVEQPGVRTISERGQRRPKVTDVAGADLRLRVAEPLAAQCLCEEELPLLRVLRWRSALT